MYSNTIIIGDLGKDPEMRYTPSGTPVTNFSVAVSKKYKKGDDWHTDTKWFRVSVWGNMAEPAFKFLSKGSRVMVEGEVNARAYMKGDEPEATLELRADNVKFLDKKGGNGSQKKNEPNPYDEQEEELEGFVP